MIEFENCNFIGSRTQAGICLIDTSNNFEGETNGLISDCDFINFGIKICKMNLNILLSNTSITKLDDKLNHMEIKLSSKGLMRFSHHSDEYELDISPDLISFGGRYCEDTINNLSKFIIDNMLYNCCDVFSCTNEKGEIMFEVSGNDIKVSDKLKFINCDKEIFSEIQRHIKLMILA